LRISISVIIPVYNSAQHLDVCLNAVAKSTRAPDECIVVDDGSTDASVEVARRAGARVLETGGRRGPSRARNIGADAASGNLLVFLDADVAIHEGTLAGIVERFERETDLDALIGSYDDEPSSPDFLSQYRNMQHCYVHRQACRLASTFWTGCGAVRRSVFLEHSGFDESRWAIEDIEFGYRMHAASRKMALDPGLQVKHLKRWTFGNWLRTDIFVRAIPWTEVILKYRRMPNDLNTGWGDRASVAGVFAIPAAAVLGGPLPAALLLALVLWLNRGFYAFLARKLGWWFAVRAVPVHMVYMIYSGAGFAIGVAKHTLKHAAAGR
jgi:glycosyltransferase involved in cell wall biosynthesis